MISFNFNEFLRYLLAGGTGIAYFFISFETPRIWVSEMPETLGGSLGFLMTSAALILGTLTYSIYRSVVYPGLCAVTDKLVGQKEPRSKYDTRRWQEMTKEDSLHRFLTEWGSQIHFLYCCGLLCLATELIGVVFEHPRSTDPLLGRLAILLFLFSAFISDFRHTKRELFVAKQGKGSC